MATLIEGEAPFRCGNHDFESHDPEEFEKHQVAEPHYVEGQTICIGRHKIMTFTKDDKVRYQGVGKDIFILCDICMEQIKK